MKRLFGLIFLMIISGGIFAQEQLVPYTLADRNRLIQVEAQMCGNTHEVNGLRNEVGSLRNEMNSMRGEIGAKIESINTRIDYIFWLLGFVVSLIFVMLGYMIWDRRTALNPVRIDVEILKRENDKFKNIFKRLAESQPHLQEISRNAGIL